MRTLLIAAFSAVICFGADQHPLEALIEAARTAPPSSRLEKLLRENTFFVYPLNRGASFVWGQDFLFAVETEDTPQLQVDGQPLLQMTRIPGSKLWYKLLKMRTGVTHSYEFFTNGKTLSQRFDVAGYNSDSYFKPGVPKGVVSEKKVLQSKIYPGMSADYWVYTSPGYDTTNGGPMMVWQDGLNLWEGDKTALRLLTVTENLVHQKLMPPVLYVMISPGVRAGETRMRSIEYDTVSDTYARYLLEEVIPEVEKTYKIRQDAYSRGIAGQSSGAICAFNVAWYFPNKFSRALSTIGSYVALQWATNQPNPADNRDGGFIVPYRIGKEAKRNIRVWLSDGSDDQVTLSGVWSLQNIEVANALKLKGYDFHFRFGEASHSPAQGALDMPEALMWLWRDYDPAKTEQLYEQEPSERAKPPFRVKISNRDAW